jgi:hypothetical protein
MSGKCSHLTDVDDLEDVVVGGELIGPNVEVDVLAAAQEVLRQSLHLLRPGSAPHAPEHQVKNDCHVNQGRRIHNYFVRIYIRSANPNY